MYKTLKNATQGLGLASFAYLCSAKMLLAAGFTSPLQAQSLQQLLVQILNAVIFILFPIIVLMVVYTGFLFVSAQGNPSKLTEARRALVWTLIGALVVLGSKAIALAVEATVNSL